MRFFKYLFLTIILFSVMFSSHITGAESPAFSLKGAYGENSKSYFNFALTPGSTLHDGLRITNHDNEREIKVKLQYKTSPNTQKIPPYWLELTEEEITISPNSNKTIDYSITIPTYAELGTYGGIFILTLENSRYVNENYKKLNNNSVGISLGVGKNFTITIAQGEPITLDKRPIIEKETLPMEEPKEKISKILFNFIADRFEIILILIIIVLGIRIIILKHTHKKITKNHK